MQLYNYTMLDHSYCATTVGSKDILMGGLTVRRTSGWLYSKSSPQWGQSFILLKLTLSQNIEYEVYIRLY